jgi:hypothetical protein
VSADQQVAHRERSSEYKYFGIDFQTPSVTAPIPANTAAAYDLKSLRGSIGSLFFSLIPVAGIAAAEYIYSVSFQGPFKTNLDGSDYFRLGTWNDMLSIQLVSGYSASYSPAYTQAFVPFEALASSNVYSGAMEKDSFSTPVFNFTTNAAVTSQVCDCLAVTNVLYKVVGGNFVKVE